MLREELRAIDQVTEAEKSRLLSLMESHYEGISPTRFREDFDAKTGVILLRDRGGVLRGFSTYQVEEKNVNGCRLRIVFSGDTVIQCEHWGGTALFRGFGSLVREMADDSGTAPYWFLTSKGHRTYRMLPVFFQEFYPRFDVDTPEWATRLFGSLAAERFGRDFDTASVLVRHDRPTDRLRTDLAEVPPRLAADPHVQFFLRCNPGYAGGDELACVAKLTPDNFQIHARGFAL